MGCDDRELVDEFLTEATELIEKLDQDLVTLEKTPEDADLLNCIFRSIHTIKGAAGFLEFDLLVKVSHKTEDVLNRLRKGELQVTTPIMDAVLEGVDLVKVLIEDIRDGKESEREIAPTVAKLEAILHGPAAAPAAAPGEAPAAEAPAVEAAVEAPAEDTAEAEQPAPVEEAASEAAAVEPPHHATLSVVTPPKETKPGKQQEKGAAPPQPKDVEEKSTVRVDVKRLDDLMNQVGELVLERNRMIHMNDDYQAGHNMKLFGPELAKLTKRLSFVTSELQMQVLKMRLVPIGNIFKKFPRIVRNLARDLGKEVDLQVFGEETELDRCVVDQISDPLIHLLRNSLDHGLERPEDRVAAGKSKVGTVTLAARHEGNRIIISISDDGHGMDPAKIAAKALSKGVVTQEQLNVMAERDILDLIFLPGFSTKEKASDVSGRGVGMDVVRTNVRNLNGIIDIRNEQGVGCEFILKLPLTLAIIQSLLVQVGHETYSLPFASVLETLRISEKEFKRIGGREVLSLRGAVLPLMRLKNTFSVVGEDKEDEYQYVVVVGSAEKRIGLVVTRLLGQQEVAVKPMGTFLSNVPGVAGSTILGDGRVALILDPAKLLEGMDGLRQEPAAA